jgi:hypothetical protein
MVIQPLLKILSRFYKATILGSFLLLTLALTTPVSAAPSPTPYPAYYSKITKTVSPGAYLGGVVDFTVTITLGSSKSGVVIEDIFSGAGKAPDTDYVLGSAKLDGNSIADPTLYANQLNRVHYLFKLGDLKAGTYTLTYKWKISSKLGCYAAATNEAHLDAAGINGHMSTSSVKFPVSCVTPTPTATPTPTPSFPPCPDINAEVKADYSYGLHWIVGNPVLQEGSDKVFSLGSNNYAQCYCPVTDTAGIQTNWLAAGGFTQSQIDTLVSMGWIFVQNGADFDLASQPYVAQNSPFTCPEPTPSDP